jgi:hypothetical protein
VIPNAAVRREGGKVGVWQLVDGELRFSPVVLGASDLDGFVQVREGLADGDQVVTLQRKGADGRSRVKVVEHIRRSRADDQPGRPRHSACLGQVRLHRRSVSGC